ncbi:MAG: ATP-binding protein, partial [Zetaproteobacteria bacterium]
GQMQARRALEIAAAGGHHLLMIGPPGVGKSMLAARLPGILPPLDEAARIEVARIYSVAGEPRSPLAADPPFRAPHHTASDAALIGGGAAPRPGEASLAHEGVLFLDELAEFSPRVLETLRQPLETGEVRIARAAMSVRFPARFQLVAAMNPCPCGYLGHPSRPCRCGPAQIRRYRARVSGPLLDRMDLRIFVSPVDREELVRMQPGEPSATVRARVAEARARQIARQGVPNARLAPAMLKKVAAMAPEAVKLLEQAQARLALSARAVHRIVRVARTIADLEGEPGIGARQMAEALALRGELD